MPVFSYKGVSDGGKTVKGTVSADSMRTARTRMRLEGVFLTQIKESDASETSSGDGTESGFRLQLPTRIPPLQLARSNTEA